MAVSARTVEQYLTLLQRVVNLRVDVMQPEHVQRLTRQLEQTRSSANSHEDYTFLFRIFTRLADAETPPTMSELSAYLALPFSSTTRLVDWLVRAELVERIHDAHDRRVVRVRMTAGGEQLYQLGREYNKQQIARLLKNFSAAEQTQLLSLLNKLLDALLADQG